MNKKFFNFLYTLNHILNLILISSLLIVSVLINSLIELLFIIVLAIELNYSDEHESGLIKNITKIEYRALINHSKHYLHDQSLDFKTNIDNIRINNCNALSILTELNSIDIPKYQNYNKCINKVKSLEPANETDSNEQTQQLNYLNEQKRILKIQILSKIQQIKDILDNEKLNYKHQKFSDEYQLIKNEINKL